MIISSNSTSVKIASKSIKSSILKKDILANQLLYRFIPDYHTKYKNKRTTLWVEDGKKMKIGDFPLKNLISGNYPNKFNSTDIIVVAEYLLERLRQEIGIYTIHSSSVYKRGNGILFFINLSGAGKTSLALYLVRRYKFRLFSDEKTALDLKNKKMVGQTKKLFVEQKTKNLLKEESILTKNFINIKKIRPKKLRLLIMPIISNSIKKTTCYHLAPSQLRWFLYEELSKDIRGVNALISSLSIPLPSLDNLRLSKKRQNLISKLSCQIPAYLILGSLKEVAKQTNQIFKNILLGH